MRSVLVLAVAATGCTPDTPYLEVREPDDLAWSTGAVYRLENDDDCGTPGMGSANPFVRVTIDNRLAEQILAVTRRADPPCAIFDGTELGPGETVHLAFEPGGTLLISDADALPLHNWLTVGEGGVTVR